MYIVIDAKTELIVKNQLLIFNLHCKQIGASLKNKSNTFSQNGDKVLAEFMI